MKISKIPFSGNYVNQKAIGVALALLSLLMTGLLGNWPVGAGLAVLFLSAAFLTRPVLLYPLWIAVCAFLSCSYPFWMADDRFSVGCQLIGLDPCRIALNLLCAGAVYGLFLLAFGRLRPAVTAASGLLLLLCVANDLIYQFRGSELRWADFLSVRTAMNVAAGYSFHLSAGDIKCILCWCWMLLAAGMLPREPAPARPLLTRAGGAATAALCVMLFCWNSGGIEQLGWVQDGSISNGYLLNFSLGLRDSVIKKPQNCSGLIDQIEAEYPEQAVSLPEELPNIVVIMEESLADMRVLGELETNQPVTPFLDSLTDNTVRGYALCSVFGGSTANSEFEFLSGSSMAFLPTGSIAYQQYLHQTTYALPWLLQSYGYDTLATHPYMETGWNRQAAYELLGFQGATFLGAYPEEDLVRGYVSDREMFQYILDRLDQLGDTPLFLFGITMQNHGGYGDSEYQNTISLQNGFFPYAEQYLSLIHETASALEYLLTQLAESPRKTVVLIFGDHFPALEDSFFQSLHGSFDSLSDKMLQYQVPFYLWANYDIPEQSGKNTSLNYLALDLLEAAGLPLSPYYRFLSDVRQTIPAVNPLGFYGADGQALAVDQASEVQTNWLRLYEAAQYNNLFGRKERSAVLFP